MSMSSFYIAVMWLALVAIVVVSCFAYLLWAAWPQSGWLLAMGVGTVATIWAVVRVDRQWRRGE